MPDAAWPSPASRPGPELDLRRVRYCTVVAEHLDLDLRGALQQTHTGRVLQRLGRGPGPARGPGRRARRPHPAAWRLDPRPDGDRRCTLRDGLATVPVGGIAPCQVVVATRAGDRNPLVARFRDCAKSLLTREA